MSTSAKNWAVDHEGALPGGTVGSLKAGPRALLKELADLENVTTGDAFPSYEYLSLRTSMNERSIQRHMEVLKSVGAVEVGRRKSNGRWLRNVYRLNVPSKYREKDAAWMEARGGHQPRIEVSPPYEDVWGIR